MSGNEFGTVRLSGAGAVRTGIDATTGRVMSGRGARTAIFRR
jgi:hypothetical protein